MFLLTGIVGAQVQAPRIGYIVDRSGSLRPIDGVAGAFVLGPAVATDVVSAAYSGKSLVIKKDRELIVDGRAFETDPGAVTITFASDGQLNEIFFPSSGALWSWKKGKFDRMLAAAIDSPATIHDGGLSLNGWPVRLPSRAQSVSQMGDGWWVVYGEDRVFAIHAEQIYEMPEDAQ